MVFDETQIARTVITGKIDRMSEIPNWYAFLNNTICFVSELSAKRLARQFRDAFPDLRFIVVEIDAGKKGGWLPKSVWEFINDPQAAPSSAA
jgi:hypothetical protein